MTPEEAGKAWIDAFNKKDLTALMALYDDNCVNAQPHLPTPLKGKAATAEDLGGFFKAFPDMTMKVLSLVASGDTVAMEWTVTGTQTGPLVGPMGTIPPTRKRVTITGAEFTKHNAQGLIVDERGYFDMASFMMQLGIMAPPQPAT
jgi:steroid delta-isomerase-like uncharacterized protein